MRNIFFLSLIFLSTTLSASSKSTANFNKMDCYEYTDAIQNAARLNVLLNNRPELYLHMKGYSQCDVGAFESMMFADCFIEKKTNKLHIILYFESIYPRLEETETKSLVKTRELFAHRIQRVIVNVCQEFIFKDLTPSSVKITAKHARASDMRNQNLLFIWDDHKIEYFPLLFDESL